MKEEPETNWTPDDEERLDAPVPEGERSAVTGVLNKLVTFGALVFATGFAMSLFDSGVVKGASRSQQLKLNHRREQLETAIREAREDDAATPNRASHP